MARSWSLRGLIVLMVVSVILPSAFSFFMAIGFLAGMSVVVLSAADKDAGRWSLLDGPAGPNEKESGA